MEKSKALSYVFSLILFQFLHGRSKQLTREMRNGEISNIQQGMSKDEGKTACSANRLSPWKLDIPCWILDIHSFSCPAFLLGKTVLKMRNGKISNIQQGMSKDEGKTACSANRLSPWKLDIPCWILDIHSFPIMKSPHIVH
jgi:hypothetical protein